MPDPSTQQSSPVITAIFAGGGTGGHLYPAIAIAEALAARIKDTHPDTPLRCVFLCSDRQIDQTILSNTTIEHAQIEIIPTGAKPMLTSPRGLLSFARSWRPTVRHARDVIRDAAKSSTHCIVIATGGFVAAPVVAAACKEPSLVAMCSLDAVEGKANALIERMLARHGGIVLDATLHGKSTPHAKAGVATHRVGPLLRRASLAPGDQHQCKQLLSLDPERPVLAVIGGSSGATSLNTAWMRFVSQHADALQHWHVLHQARADEHDTLRAGYDSAKIDARIESLFDPMGVVWGAADLAISRAGASSVAEVAANATPTVFVPYPYHKDMHQLYNAELLKNRSAAEIVREIVNDPNATVNRFAETVVPLLGDQAARDAIRSRLVSLSKSESDENSIYIGPFGADLAATALLSSLALY
ncbi:MAG: UDP-N-acetylglucosamine--N-acetylmuramyl-(pentapeptide) pyrophosphoryl-undecaprenol N-acetylglucosamine transferase [Phycisphaeraceae bacterium]|nr:UDP-N-acetylglucosamine--N-acetylmuramyl-(pentapeptide) pyrophosphoryl-undecaprenol N-acetylglucosamine transferase [Phycisphaerales bacterium]MCB9859011.1 UDP-N-acetylglucosamine--N-acetylmuramyl-(pentapeptide) pyrophosphoryl-undecaprenol N-acetylglucosamine transferase [Phycisphaeraceae bacterium]